MTLIKRSILTLLFAATTLTLLAQHVDPTTPIDELTMDEGDRRIEEMEAALKQTGHRATLLVKELEAVQAEIARHKAASLECDRQLHALVGVTMADVQRFHEQVDLLDRRLAEIGKMENGGRAGRKGEIDSLAKKLTALRGEPVSIFPQFFDRIVRMKQMIHRLEGKEVR